MSFRLFLVISGLLWGLAGCSPTRSVSTSEDAPESPVIPDSRPQPPTPPSGTVAVVPYTRLLCQPEPQESASRFDTILTNAGITGLPSMLSLEQTGLKLNAIDQLEMISGNESSFDFILTNVVATEKKVDLYLGKMDLLYKKASFNKLGSAPLNGAVSPSPSPSPFSQPGIARFFSFSRLNKSLLVPDPIEDRYVIRDSFSPQVLSMVLLSPKQYLNPVLAGNADMALFQKIEKGALRNYAYSLETDQAIPFPTTTETLIQYQPHIFLTGQMAWLEKTTSGLQMKLATWNDLLNKKATTLMTIDQENLTAMDFGARQGFLYLAQAFETYQNLSPGRKLKEGFLKVSEWNLADLREQKNQVVPYPTLFYNRVLSGDESIVEQILYSPWSNQWVVANPRGVSVFNNKTMTWDFAGPQGYLTCLRPTLGPEYHVEEVYP